MRLGGWDTTMGGLGGVDMIVYPCRSLRKLIKVTTYLTGRCIGKTRSGVLSNMGPGDIVIRNHFVIFMFIYLWSVENEKLIFLKLVICTDEQQ